MNGGATPRQATWRPALNRPYYRYARRSSRGQREHHQSTAEARVLLQGRIAAHRSEARGRLLQPRRHADSGPAADAGEHADVLLATVLISEHVADDSRRAVEFPQQLPGARVHRLQPAIEGAVERDAAGCREHARPDREALRIRPYD